MRLGEAVWKATLIRVRRRRRLGCGLQQGLTRWRSSRFIRMAGDDHEREVAWEGKK